MRNIDSILSQRRILVTCGTGGVGKTTLSAAIAIRAALMGKRAVVVTIDPAKRLSTSLGIQGLGDAPTDLTEKLREACRRVAPERADFTGKLEAIIPDTRQTFETFVRSLSPSPAAAERIMRSPIFQIFAKEFSGTNEYMALERLYELSKLTEYDCIILDTPPSRNTLAFLEAPGLLARLFEERLIRWLAIPANKLVAAGMRKSLSILEKLTGSGFMTQLMEFSTALLEVQAGFMANLKKVTELLESEQVGFIMVTAPAPDTVPETRSFIEALRKHRLRFDGLVINRTVGHLKKKASHELADELADELIRALQERETKILSHLGSDVPLCAQLPELARDVHSIEDLLHVALVFGH